MDTYTENYLSKIPKGEKIILKAQPDNPIDPYAIAAYIDCSQRIGYVNAGELDDVRPLLDFLFLCCYCYTLIPQNHYKLYFLSA